MKKAGIIALIVGVVLTLVGAAVVFFVFFSINFDFSKLNYDFTSGSSESYVEKVYDVNDSFDSIYIEDSSADITFAKSENDKAYVESFEREDVSYDVKVNNKTLSIIRNKKLFSLSFNTPDTYLTVYLPQKAYDELTIKVASSDIILSEEFEFASVDIDTASGDVSVASKIIKSLSINVASSDIAVSNCEAKKVKLHTASGEITINNLNGCEEIEVSTASGEIEISDVKAKNFKGSSASGEQSLKNVVAENKIDLNSGSGEILLYGCDAQDIHISTASGDVYGELLSKKIFVTDTASGDVKISPDAYGEDGECRVETASGDITLKLSE